MARAIRRHLAPSPDRDPGRGEALAAMQAAVDARHRQVAGDPDPCSGAPASMRTLSALLAAMDEW